MNKNLNGYLKAGITLGVFILLIVFLNSKFSSDSQLAQVVYPPVTAPINPVTFWEFSGANPTAQKTPASISTTPQQFGASETSTWTTGTGGKVGNFIDLSGSGNTAGNLTPSANGWAVEFLFKPSRTFETGTIFSFGSNFKLQFMAPVGGNPNGWVPSWKLTMNGTEASIYLDEIGRKSLSYIANGNWHHFVVQYDPASSQKVQFWIDGQLATGYALNNTVSTSGSVKFSSMSGGEYTQCNCSLDQIALYNRSLPPNLILEHSNNTNAGVAYSTTTTITTVPTPDSVTGTYNPLDFMVGTNLSSSSGQTPGVSVPVIDQLETYPLPRYKDSNTLIRNVSGWLALDYLANNGSSSISGASIGNNATNHAKSKEINKQLATKWNYHIQTSLNAGSGNGYEIAGRQLANDPTYLSIPTAAITFRAQLNGNDACGANPPSQNSPAGQNTPCLRYQLFPNNHYLQNSAGSFLNSQGGLVDTNASFPNNLKVWRPVSTYLSSYTPDGEEVKSQLQSIINAIPNRVAQYPTRAIDIINENGEIFPTITPSDVNSVVNNDPVVLAAKNASGLDAYTYVARQFSVNERAYADKLKSIPALSNSTFTEYAVEGEHMYEFKWSEARKVHDQINGQYYATPDLYLRDPWNWRYWNSAWHGWQWLVNSRNGELAEGDNLFSPFISAGWAPVEREIVRPAQILGFSKAVAVTGAEFFYPGVFNMNNSQDPYPENYVWQASIPSYAQGVTSYYEDILRNGKLMKGDTTRWMYPQDTNPGFRFYTGNPGHLVVARKQNNVNRFVISGMENPWSNYQGNVPEESVADIMFGGDTYPSTTVTPTENLKFKVRRQGSTYIYDKTGASPVFYQLDGWHESSHPWHWSKDFNFEAEVYDSGSASRTTTVPAGTPAGDYTNFTTYINPASGSTTYKFEPRNATTNGTETRYVWYRARSNAGSTTAVNANVTIGTAPSKTLAVNNSSYVWCNKDASGQVLSFNVNQNVSSEFKFTGSNPNFHFDQFVLTTNPSSTMFQANCATGGTPNVSPVVTITSPTTNQTYTSSTSSLTLGGTATDVDGTITALSWTNTVSGSLVGSGSITPTTSPWTKNITLVPGVNVIVITALDNATQAGTGSDSISVTYAPDTTPPTLSLTAPTNGLVLSGNYMLSATATDSSGISSVYFTYKLLPSGTVTQVPGTVTSGPNNTYTLSWNTTLLADGNYEIKAVAQDSSPNANITTTSGVTVSLDNIIVVPDTTDPIVSFTTPTSGSTVSGNVNLSATASDPGANASGVSFVQFSYKAQAAGTYTTLGQSTGNGGVYQYAWNTVSLGLPDGVYNLKARAQDGSGNDSEVTITITVTNTVQLPDVIVTDITWNPVTPSQNQPTTFSAKVKNIGTVATPASVITGVAFYVDNNLVNIVGWSDSYTQSLAPGQEVTLTVNGGPTNGGIWLGSVGSHSVTAIVDDINRYPESNETNNSFTKTGLNVVTGPSLVWVFPTDGAVVNTLQPYTLSVNATGPITTVKYFRKGNQHCKSVTPPNFTCPWTPSGILSATITWQAKGYNAQGALIATTPVISVTRH